MYCHAILNISCPKFSLPTSAGLFGCTGQDPHKLVLVHPHNLTWCNGKSPMLKMSSVFSPPSELTISFTLLQQRRRKKISSRDTWPRLLKGSLRNLKDEARQRKWKAGSRPLHLCLQAVTFTVLPLGKIIRNYKGWEEREGATKHKQVNKQVNNRNWGRESGLDFCCKSFGPWL